MVQEKLFDTGCKEEGTDKHRLYHCPVWNEVRHQLPDPCRRWQQKAKTSKKEWKWQIGIVEHPQSEKPMEQCHLSMKKWKSEKHKKLVCASRRLQGPRCH